MRRTGASDESSLRPSICRPITLMKGAAPSSETKLGVVAVRWFILSALVLFSTSSVAVAACDGDACYHGFLRDCVRYRSGDSVWVNHKPFTRCQEKAPGQATQPARPPIQYNYPPKRKYPEPPSPHVGSSERARRCLDLQKEYLRKLEAWFCSGSSRIPHFKPEKEDILAQCPQLGEDWGAVAARVPHSCALPSR